MGLTRDLSADNMYPINFCFEVLMGFSKADKRLKIFEATSTLPSYIAVAASTSGCSHKMDTGDLWTGGLTLSTGDLWTGDLTLSLPLETSELTKALLGTCETS